MIRGFWEQVSKTEGCWEWQGGVGVRGYGSFWVGGYAVRAHRFSYLITYGAFDEQLMVCHSCDNPICVRPDHLFLGTSLDNMRDASAKGRMPGYSMPGEQNLRAVLTSDSVRSIRSLARTGQLSQKEISEQFGVSPTTIGQIVRRERWKSLT